MNSHNHKSETTLYNTGRKGKKKKADWDEPLYVIIIHSKHYCMKHNYSVLE